MPEGAEEPALLKRGDGRPREAKVDASRFDKLKTVLRVTSGNFLELYDFFLFGIYARQIGHTFFPNHRGMYPTAAKALGRCCCRLGALHLEPAMSILPRHARSTTL